MKTFLVEIEHTIPDKSEGKLILHEGNKASAKIECKHIIEAVNMFYAKFPFDFSYVTKMTITEIK